jgi:hypothetical protein
MLKLKRGKLRAGKAELAQRSSQKPAKSFNPQPDNLRTGDAGLASWAMRVKLNVMLLKT